MRFPFTYLSLSILCLSQHPVSASLRSAVTTIFNYLVPITRTAIDLGLRIFRTQVWPRFGAAAAAFVNPHRARSQQRDVNVIIIPITIQQQQLSNDPQDALATNPLESSSTPALPDVPHSAAPHPTFVFLFPVPTTHPTSGNQ